MYGMGNGLLNPVVVSCLVLGLRFVGLGFRDVQHPRFKVVHFQNLANVCYLIRFVTGFSDDVLSSVEKTPHNGSLMLKGMV